jgi:hypothetical protein
MNLGVRRAICVKTLDMPDQLTVNALAPGKPFDNDGSETFWEATISSGGPWEFDPRAGQQ